MGPGPSRATAWLVAALALAVAQAMTFADVPKEIGPYHQIVGTIVVFLGALLALSGKGVLRLYAGLCGCLLGAFASYLVIEKIDHHDPIGPNKPAIEVLVAFFSAMAGIALFLMLLKLVVIGIGVLAGLVLTALLLSLPVIERIRHYVPVWGVALVMVVLCSGSVWVFQDTVLLFFTAGVGAFFASVGVDMWLQTGFNQQVVALLTRHPTEPFKVTAAMLPLLYTFVCVFVVGAMAQVCAARRDERKRREGSLPYMYNNTERAPLRPQKSIGGSYQARVLS